MAVTIVKGKPIRYISEKATSVEDKIYSFQHSNFLSDAVEVYTVATQLTAGTTSEYAQNATTKVVTWTNSGGSATDPSTILSTGDVIYITGNATYNLVLNGKYFEVLSSTSTTVTFYCPDTVDVGTCTTNSIRRVLPAFADMDEVEFISAMCTGTTAGAAYIYAPVYVLPAAPVTVHTNLTTSPFYTGKIIPLFSTHPISTKVNFKTEGVINAA